MRKTQTGIAPYLDLARRFLDGDLPADRFVLQFQDRFKQDPTPFGPAVHEALNDLFLLAEDFCDDPALVEPGDTTPDMLARGARDFLAALGLPPGH